MPVQFLCLKVWNESGHILSFVVSNWLTGKGWVNPLRALLSAIFCRVRGLCFLASVSKLCLKYLYFMWNMARVPHCGPFSIFQQKMIHLVINLHFNLSHTLSSIPCKSKLGLDTVHPPQKSRLEGTPWPPVQRKGHSCAKTPKTWWKP